MCSIDSLLATMVKRIFMIRVIHSTPLEDAVMHWYVYIHWFADVTTTCIDLWVCKENHCKR